MIDRIARDQLALAIRRLGSGQMSIAAFCDAVAAIERRCNPADTLAKEVADEWYWFASIGLENMFVDFDALRGDFRLTRSGRRYFARHWLLLKSDCVAWCRDYTEHKPILKTPRVSWLHRVGELDLCGARRTRYRELRHLRSIGVLRRIAPFSSTHEFHTARSRRIFFVGSTSASSAASH